MISIKNMEDKCLVNDNMVGLESFDIAPSRGIRRNLESAVEDEND